MSRFKQIDYTNKRFGRLLVLGIHHHSTTGHTYVTCKCDCGKIKIVRASCLVQGVTRSCGCLEKESKIKNSTKHGLYGTRIYRIWMGMKRRCYDTKVEQYKNYGGRGISYCQEWEKFIPFYNWAMANGYNDNLTIDRIDVNGDYEPNNCRWIKEKEQHRNTRSNKILKYKGKSYCAKKWAEILGLNYNTLLTHLRKGMTIKDALEYKKI